MITVAIIEGDPIFGQTLYEWITSTPGYRCVCTSTTCREALVTIPRLSPDVVLMPIYFSGGRSGIVCTQLLKKILPMLQIIILTGCKERAIIFQALEAGACGYLLKGSSREEILQAISEAQNGGSPMTGEITRMLVETFQKAAPKQPEENLSSREAEILMVVATGLTNKEIAQKLNISTDTVRNHLRHIFEKLRVRCRAEAVMKYFGRQTHTQTVELGLSNRKYQTAKKLELNMNVDGMSSYATTEKLSELPKRSLTHIGNLIEAV